jgi:hypothetical protein
LGSCASRTAPAGRHTRSALGGVPAAEPGGYQYSRWCELYRDWESRLSPTMRQAHPAGERLFVDYAGQTVPVIDAKTGAITPAQTFVAVLGASNYTYAEATATQTLPDWIGAHARTLAFLGGVPRQIVPTEPGPTGGEEAHGRWMSKSMAGVEKPMHGQCRHNGTHDQDEPELLVLAHAAAPPATASIALISR